MKNEDLRWVQSFNNYKKALAQLNNAVAITKQRDLSELEQQGLIQGFEYTHEMAWKTLKRFLEHKGVEKLFGSKDTTRKAHSLDLLSDGDTWMDMIKSRNKTSHTYNQEVADEVLKSVIEKYHPLFNQLSEKLETLVEE